MSSVGETKLERVIAPICSAHGVDLVDVEERAQLIVVTVERSDGLDLDRVAEVARAISVVLDEDESLFSASNYELEVSSPGLERRLRRAAHFAKAVAQRVAIKTVAGTPGDRRFQGTIASTDDDGFVITLDGTNEQRRVLYSEIERAHTVVDWDAAFRQGKKRNQREKVAM